MEQQVQQNLALATELEKITLIKMKYECFYDLLEKEEDKQLICMLIGTFNMIINTITYATPSYSIQFIRSMKESFIKTAPDNEESRKFVIICDNIYSLLNLPVLG